MAEFYKKDEILDLLRNRVIELKTPPTTTAEYNDSFAVQRVIGIIERDARVVDAEPVLHAHIINTGNPICGHCSSCGESVNLKWKRCPICEAKFDEEAAE